MKLREYIESYYPIRAKVQQKLVSPLQRVMDADDLPYDSIQVVDGILQKVVYLNDEEYISVMELLSYDEKDIMGMKDPELVNAWTIYMSNIDVEDLAVQDLMSVSKEYLKGREKRKELAEQCMK